MRFHKTFKADRTTYKYEFFNDDGDKKTITIYPCKDGVTELDIKRLHNKDDYEVERNIANCRPELTEREKQIIADWTANYIKNFQVQYGYIPCNADIHTAVYERFPANWNISLEEAERLFGDKNSILSNANEIKEQEACDAVKERIDFLLKDLSARDKEIYKRVLLNKETKISVATDLGISDSFVSRIAKQIEAKLASDDFLKKFFIFSSDSTKNDRLDTQEVENAN